ncbi:restriction endonuclease [Streptomyces sp. NPDC002054]|uniref:restriction endonuclease n=1 Tax=Streptomyces sp. NPDC002054 TaxID=3154663 RepID=UPI003319CFDB
MINESVLLESQTLRAGVLDRTDVLDRVRTLSLLPDGLHVTTAMVAAYYEVTDNVIRQLSQRHRGELSINGMTVLQGEQMRQFESDNLSLSTHRRSLTIYSRRAVLNIGMLLRDSEVARQVRTYLLDTEHAARTQPVDKVVHRPPWEAIDERIDDRITDVLRMTVTPMLNALIETAGEQRKELISLREDVDRIRQRLDRHEPARGVPALTGIMGTIDAMNWRQFEHHVAGLLRRDGCTDVVVHGGHGDRGVDISARTADGRKVAVQCKNFAPFRHVLSAEMQKFLGAAKVLHQADVALFVATCAFTRESLAIAAETGVTAVHRGLLEAWSSGVALQALR